MIPLGVALSMIRALYALGVIYFKLNTKLLVVCFYVLPLEITFFSCYIIVYYALAHALEQATIWLLVAVIHVLALDDPKQEKYHKAASSTHVMIRFLVFFSPILIT